MKATRAGLKAGTTLSVCMKARHRTLARRSVTVKP
jgi:hypothetical protein